MPIVLLFFAGNARAQNLHELTSFGGEELLAYSIDQADVFSSRCNQASLADRKHFSFGVFAEKKYFLSELNTGSLSFALPTRSGNFGMSAEFSGPAAYHETRVGLAYARKLLTDLDAGVQFNYYSIRIASGYGYASALSFEAGCLLRLSDKLRTGISVSNAGGGKFGKSGEKLASRFGFGIGYQPSDKFYFGLEVQKEENLPVNIRAAMQYSFLQRVTVEAGLGTATGSVFGGAGFVFGKLKLGLIAGFHPQLGLSPGLELVYSPVNKKQ